MTLQKDVNTKRLIRREIRRDSRTNKDKQGSGGGTSDHTALTNIGTNTHAQLDTHLADATVHFTEASLGLEASFDSKLDIGASNSLLTNGEGFLTSADLTNYAELATANVFTTTQLFNSTAGTSDIKLILASQDTNRGVISWRSDGQASADQRWTLQTDDVAESGANAGTDMTLTAYSDTGVSLGDVWTADRSTQEFTVNKRLIVEAPNGTNPSMRFYADSGEDVDIIFYDLGGATIKALLRWNSPTNVWTWSDRTGTATDRWEFDFETGDTKLLTGDLFIDNMKTGSTQVNAGAGAGELWATASHATLPDNVVLIGV